MTSKKTIGIQSPFSSSIEYFLKIAEEKSFNAAAERLGVRQSTLSSTIAKLEMQLGRTLLKRGRQGISLTSEGARLLPLWKELKSSFQAGTLEALAGTDAMTSRVGVVAHLAYKRMIPFLRSDTTLQSQLQLYFMNSLHIFEGVKDGRLDFGFITWTTKPSGVKSEYICADPVAVVGLKSKFAHIAQAKNRKDLASEPWAFYPKPQRDWGRILGPQEQGFIIRDIQAFKEIILSGLSIAEVQLNMFTDQQLKRLVRAPVPSRYDRIDLYAISRGDLAGVHQKKYEKFCEIFRE